MCSQSLYKNYTLSEFCHWCIFFYNLYKIYIIYYNFETYIRRVTGRYAENSNINQA